MLREFRLRVTYRERFDLSDCHQTEIKAHFYKLLSDAKYPPQFFNFGIEAELLIQICQDKLKPIQCTRFEEHLASVHSSYCYTSTMVHYDNLGQSRIYTVDDFVDQDRSTGKRLKVIIIRQRPCSVLFYNTLQYWRSLRAYLKRTQVLIDITSTKWR